MAVSNSKFVGIKGCAVYRCENDVPITSAPQVDNVTITVPEITFNTVDVNIMGTVSIPDMTSLDNIQLSVNIPVDNPDAAELMQVGLQNWRISYVVSNVNNQGVETITPCSIYATGFVTGIPNAEISKGGDGTADVTMNLMRFKKYTGERVDIDIDRSTGTLIIKGVNYNTISSLY